MGEGESKMNSVVNVYKKNQINTASSENLVLMLYDGARKFISRSIISLENQDIQSANYNLQRSQDILSELMSGVNFEAGELAEKLFALYEYMHYQLVQANLKKDRQYAEQVLTMIEELRNVWAQALKGGFIQEEMNINRNKIAN